MIYSHFDNLAGVRGWAATIVLLAHVVQVYFLRFEQNTLLHRFSSIASEYSVVVFFILSGFLISHTLELNIKENGKLRIGVYIAARIARLYPPFLFAIVLSFAVFFVMDYFGLPGRKVMLSHPGDLFAVRDIVNTSLRDLVYALFMLQGLLEINGPLWSLYMEAKLYVLFACLLALIGGGRGFYEKIGLLIALVTVTMTAFRFNPDFARYAGFWFTGVLAQYIWTQHPYNRTHFRMVFCFILILIAQYLHVVKDGASFSMVLYDFCVASLISWLLFRIKIRLPCPRQLVESSYSLYLTHFPILLLGQSLLISIGNSTMSLAIGVAMLSAFVATAVAFLGGVIESKKSQVEKWLISYARC